MSKEEKQKDYTKYQFNPDEKLEVNAGLLGNIGQFLEALLETDHIGCTRLTEPRYNYIHKETGEPAKQNTASDILKTDYQKIMDIQRTLNAPIVQSYTPIGKQLMFFLESLSRVQMENIDNGRGFIKDEKPSLEKVD